MEIQSSFPYPPNVLRNKVIYSVKLKNKNVMYCCGSFSKHQISEDKSQSSLQCPCLSAHQRETCFCPSPAFNPKLAIPPPVLLSASPSYIGERFGSDRSSRSSASAPPPPHTILATASLCQRPESSSISGIPFILKSYDDQQESIIFNLQCPMSAVAMVPCLY